MYTLFLLINIKSNEFYVFKQIMLLGFKKRKMKWVLEN